MPGDRLPVRGHGRSGPDAAGRRAGLEADKPLVLYKIATGREGARAALSHTGSLAGSEAAYAAGFARAGVIQVDKLEALVEAAAFFAKLPSAKAGVPRARGVAVIATSGGATIIAADKAEAHGVALPQRVPRRPGSLRRKCRNTARPVTRAT